MEDNKDFNQNLLKLIESSRFRGTKSLKRKDPPITISYEQNNLKTELTPISVTKSIEPPQVPPVSNTVKIPPQSPSKQPPPQQPSPLVVKFFMPSLLTSRKNFQNAYGIIKEMRSDKSAPVDTMGSYQNPDQSATKEVQDYQLLISLLLSVQTKDEPATTAMNRLIERGLTLEEMEAIDEEELKKLISCVNFKNNKAKYIKKTTHLILNNYKGKIPTRLEELLKLPGVGKETAIVYLNHTHDKKSGIGVDTHIHRISNRLGWVTTKTPEQTRIELESFVPKEYWYDMNELLIGFGQQICTPVAPKCEGCLLNTICPTGIKNLKTGEAKVVRKKLKKEDEPEKSEKKQKSDAEVAEESQASLEIDGIQLVKEHENNEIYQNDEEGSNSKGMEIENLKSSKT